MKAKMVDELSYGWVGNVGKKCKKGKIAFLSAIQKWRTAGNVGKKGKKIIFQL